jgi:hypothetical protein
MIAVLLARYGLHIGIAAAVIVGYVAWDASRVHKGVQKERARVERQGNKIDAKAQDARRAATAKPKRVLERFYRD